MPKCIAGLIFLIAASAFSVAVQADPVGPTANALAQANMPQNSGLVSLDFQDADIRSVLKVLAFKSGVNIVAAPDVTGVVNIELKDVPWQKALEVILSTYGYGYDRKDNIITVMSIENLKKYREDTQALQAQEPLVSKTFYLSFGKAEDVMKIIDKMVSKRGFIGFDSRTNAIIVRDLESNLELISAAINSLDTVTPQVLIETRVIETDLGNNENFGVLWGTTTSGLQVTASGAEKPTIFPFTSTQPNGSFNPQNTTFGQAPAPGLASPTTAGFAYGTINASQLSATLSVLSSRSKTHTLSNPRVVTLDNEKTVINVGIQYPEATYAFNANTGQEQVTGYSFIPIGVNFEVTPHVNNPGLVTLDVHPQISAIDSNAGIAAPTINGTSPFPILSNEEARTKVMVEDGKTLVIAGLITDQITDNKYEIPFFGELPLIGHLFKYTTHTRARDELLIFITPHVITDFK